MRKSITTQELKSKVGEIVDSFRLRGDHYIIERRGKPVAAVVPMEVSERDARERKEFFDLIEKVSQRNISIPPEEIEDAINQAIAEVRAEKRRERATA